MHITHVALWTPDLEALAAFYARHFDAVVGPRYTNAAKGFESHFITFPSGARLEIMRRPEILAERPEILAGPSAASPVRPGWAHIAFAVGSPEAVEALTARLRAEGAPVVDGPRWTGDGYYESVVLDPDGNPVEITM